MTNSNGKTGNPHALEWNLFLIINHVQKLTHNGSNLNIRLTNFKTLRRKWEKLHGSGFSNGFLDTIQKAQAESTGRKNR